MTAKGGLVCASCNTTYINDGAFPDLIVGGRFDDPPDSARSVYEERSNHFTAENFLLPLFARLAPRPRQILSLGCGNGADVDLLVDAGYEAVGIDCGNRAGAWPARRHAERFCLANGEHLPFEDATFDLAYCGCVFPHVGVDGDSDRVRPDYKAKRVAVATEMTRVLKPGGCVLVSSPNRWCPVDLFHGRTSASPLPRWNPPGSRFLLAPSDYREIFRSAGCDRFDLLSPAGYWGFLNRRNSWSGRLLVLPVQAMFGLLSLEQLRFLRGAPISPWLVMLMHKAKGVPDR